MTHAADQILVADAAVAIAAPPLAEPRGFSGMYNSTHVAQSFLLGPTMGVWAHPHLGHTRASRTEDGRICVEGRLGVALMSWQRWLSYFCSLDFGPDGWRPGPED